jgi:uroporphyrinogen decarboxylase
VQRSTNCLAKLERMNRALKHSEPDRVPVSDFFWGGFLDRWRRELGLPADADIYRYYDLDWVQTNPNMDPHIQPFEILRSDQTEVVVKTGFGATIRKRLDLPMPAFIGFETSTVEAMDAFQFEDPWDERRYFHRGDDQISGVGDGFARDLAPFVDRVNERWSDFPVYGGVCEGHEMLWRIIGSENAMLWMALYPDAIARFVERICAFSLEIARAQIKAAAGKLDGMVIWGDVAYRKGMLFSPDYWRRVFKPGVQAIVEECHAHSLPVIYHGCGCSKRIFEDIIEIGVDAYNPLEAKAGMDVIELRRAYGHRIAFCGNMDVMVWADGSREEITRAALTRLNAAKGGGYIFQSDHSVPSNVSGENYDYVVNLVRQHGTYPLCLGEYDLPV